MTELEEKHEIVEVLNQLGIIDKHINEWVLTFQLGSDMTIPFKRRKEILLKLVIMGIHNGNTTVKDCKPQCNLLKTQTNEIVKHELDRMEFDDKGKPLNEYAMNNLLDRLK